MDKLKLFLVVTILLMANGICSSQNIKVENMNSKNTEPKLIQFNGTDLQSAINSAPPFSTIICNRSHQLIISKAVIIEKPITIKNLNAILLDSLGKTAILEVHSEEVTITDFRLRGNANSIDQSVRAPLIKIYKSNFRLERGLFENSSKDGVEISPMANSEDIDGGIVRDIVGRGCVRDVISISGRYLKGKSTYVRNILVSNIRGYDSSMRGTVEVSDGSVNITVRKIYAENSVYAVDWQDHGHDTEINRNVIIDDVYALNCVFAIRNSVKDFGHTNLTITNVISEKCRQPLKIINTSNVIIQNVRIIDQLGDLNPILVQNCNGFKLQNISISNIISQKEGILIENSNEVLIDGVSFLGNTENLSSAITYSVSNDKVFENLIIRNVSNKISSRAGISLLKKNNATLKNYLISNNISRVTDQIQGENGLIVNNVLITK